MKGRVILWILASGLASFGCRKPQTVTPAPAGIPAWTELRGDWIEVAGGAVDQTDEGLLISWSEELTAARWGGEVPTFPFEFEAQARRINGSDFFFSLTFPGRNEGEAATWIVGGWGGGVVGISSIDGLDASENETNRIMTFEQERWYALRFRATEDRLRAWIDDEMVIDVDIRDKRLSLRPGPIEACLPFGLATWQTTGEARGMRWRRLAEPP